MDNHCGSVVFVISSRATASFRDGEQVLNRPFTVTPAWVAVACVIGAALWVGGPSTWREIVWERLLGGASAESLRSDDAREQDRKDEHSSRASNSDRGPRYASRYLEQESAGFDEDPNAGKDESLLNLPPGRTARASSSRDARSASRRTDARVVRSEPSYSDQEADRPVRPHRVASPERSRSAARRPEIGRAHV